MPVVNLVAVPGGLLPDAEIIDESNWNILRNPNVPLGLLNCNATLNFRTAADPGRLSCSLLFLFLTPGTKYLYQLLFG